MMNEDTKELHNVELVNIDTGEVIMKLNSIKESDYCSEEDNTLTHINELNAWLKKENSRIKIDVIKSGYEEGYNFHVKKLSVIKDYTTQKARIEYVDVRRFDEDGIHQAYKLALQLHYKEKNKVI